MLWPMQCQCPCAALFSHGAGRLAEGGGFFGFHNFSYYTTNECCLSSGNRTFSHVVGDLTDCAILSSNQAVSMQRVIEDHPIPFVILFGLILLTVSLWRWFKDR